MPRIDLIKKEFPNLLVKDLQGGCNVYLPGSLVLTFWFKKKKWYSNKTKRWGLFADTEDILHIIDKLGDIQIRKPLKGPEIKPQVNTTQLCIDHVKNKIKVVEGVKGNNAILTVLKSLVLEFEQFL